MKESKIIEMLRELGFNRIEAQIYIFLLPHSPMTAYKIAQKIGKPAANVYKAVAAAFEHTFRLSSEGNIKIYKYFFL